MKLLLVDDHPLFLEGFRRVLEDMLEDLIVLTATSARCAVAEIKRNPDLDCICLDLRLPDSDGRSFLADLHAQYIATPVLIVSANDQPSVVHRALTSGASGYLSKTAPRHEIAAALRAMATTGRYVSAELRKPLDNFRAGIGMAGTGAVSLTHRQREVLRLMARGLTNRQIADALEVTESTVKGHVSMLFRALDSNNRTGCIREAQRLDLLD